MYVEVVHPKCIDFVAFEDHGNITTIKCRVIVVKREMKEAI
jgi:hypothetical protein